MPRPGIVSESVGQEEEKDDAVWHRAATAACGIVAA